MGLIANSFAAGFCLMGALSVIRSGGLGPFLTLFALSALNVVLVVAQVSQ